jgi:hypothetical protein
MSRTFNIVKIIRNRNLLIPVVLAVLIMVPVYIAVTGYVMPRITITYFEPFIYEEPQELYISIPDVCTPTPKDKEVLQSLESVISEDSGEVNEIAVSLVIEETMEIAVNSTVNVDGNSVITFGDIASDEVVLSVIYIDGAILVDASAFDIPELEGYEYIAIDTAHEMADQIIAGAVVGINDGWVNCAETPVYHASSGLSEQIWELIETIYDTAIRDDDLSWLEEDYWEFEETPLFWLYDFPAIAEQMTYIHQVSALLSNWATHQQHLLSYILFDCEELKNRLIYFCVCEDINILAVVEAYDWLWADENEEIRTRYFQVYVDQKLLAFNTLTNRGLITRDFTRAMYHILNNDHYRNRHIAERVIEVMSEEWSTELMEDIAEIMGIDIDELDITGESGNVAEFG